MNIKPIRDRLVVVKDDEPVKTPGGLLFVPATAEDKISTGKVVAVGSGIITETGIVPLEVRAGDRVRFGRTAGVELTSDSGPVIMLHESDILCVVA